MRPNHNFPSGPIHGCQVCGHQDLHLVLDLGHQPLCDTLLSAEELSHPETTYPLRQMWCPKCTLSQLDYAVPGEVVYHTTYPYRTGITRELAEYQHQMAASLIDTLQLQTDQFIVDVGSNDGTLLSGFRARQMRVLGVEPTAIARYAQDAGIETLQAPFTPAVARQIVQSHGQAKLVTATNVFAHMATLGDVISGLEILVADDGHFVLENHYLEPIMERLQFDTIYHEHLRTYSLKSLVTLFDYYDFTVVHAEKVPRYGGNIRAYVAKGKNRPWRDSIAQILTDESKHFEDPSYYEHFGRRSLQLKNDLLKLALRCQAEGQPLVGNSCPGRCSTLLNFAGIGPDLMPYIAEQPTSLKLGKFLPGRHIPIVNNQRLLDEQPENVVLLAWHYAQPIGEQLRARGLRSKMYVPMPEVKLADI
jgi:C-methyltransferase C-terminal domain/Putative zinc binding domain/Methyltransferase domain